MSCQISKGKYYAPNGVESKLYKQLENKVGKEQARDLFVLAYSDDFQRDSVKGLDENQEPSVLEVVEFARKINEEKEPLNTEEKIEIQMMMSEFPEIENSSDLTVRMEQAFYKDGMFAPTVKSLTQFLYSRFEAENLLSNLDALSRVKTTIEKLKRTEVFDNEYSVETLKKSDEVNSVGKFKMTNPYIKNQDLIEQFGGVENPDLSEVTDETITEDYLKEFKRIPVIDEQGNPVVNKIVYENAAKLVEDPQIFEVKSEEELKEMLVDYGMQIESVPPMLLLRFLENPTFENLDAINATSPQRESVISIQKQDRDLVYLETLKSEQELFDSMNLLQTETPNVYHRVEKVDFEEMKQALELDENITELQAYKDYFGYNNSPAKTKEEYLGTPITTDIEYLKDEFIADFNIEILKNPNHEFYNKFMVNEKGILLKYSDPVSMNQINTYLKDGVKYGEELKDYSVLSKNIPNLREGESEMNTILWAANNKNKLKKPTTEVSTVNTTTITVKNETEDFINYKDRVFQLQNKEGNKSVYMELEVSEDLNYFQTEVGQKEYQKQIKDKTQKPTTYNSIKKLYKKDELEDNFDCI